MNRIEIPFYSKKGVLFTLLPYLGRYELWGRIMVITCKQSKQIWNENQKAFKSTPIKEWTVSHWFFHIKDIVKSGLNLELSIDDKTTWENITDEEKNKIKNALQQRV